MDCIWVNLKKNVGLPFLKFMVLVCQCIHVLKCHLHSWKNILSYVAMMLEMKDSWSAKYC